MKIEQFEVSEIKENEYINPATLFNKIKETIKNTPIDERMAIKIDSNRNFNIFMDKGNGYYIQIDVEYIKGQYCLLYREKRPLIEDDNTYDSDINYTITLEEKDKDLFEELFIHVKELLKRM
nr:MAG TPA: hypothetical protein [Caudoviricetes sp.]